jgi:hypothetical protein
MSEPQKKPGSWLFTLLKGALVLVLVAGLGILGVGLFVLDGRYEVSREITIKAPPQVVHQQVGDLRAWPKWLPFTKQDPSIQTTIVQPTGVGANQNWVGKDGKGQLSFTASDEQKGIAFDMLFDEKYASQGSLTYTPAGDQTRVTWRMTGRCDDFMGRWLSLAMGSMVGPMFEQGLADLKTTVEAQ